MRMSEPEKKYRVWYVINPPNNPNYVDVGNPREGAEVIKAEIERELQLPWIRSNAFGLEVNDGCGWTEWYSEDGNDVMEEFDTLLKIPTPPPACAPESTIVLWWNNTCVTGTCPVCCETFKPSWGLVPFLSGTSDPVCWECTEKLSPIIFASAKVAHIYQTIIINMADAIEKKYPHQPG